MLTATVVLSYASWRYVADRYQPFDSAATTFAFDADRGTIADVPADVRQPDGRRVVVKGRMLSLAGDERASRFALIPDLRADGSCSYCPPVQDVVVVDAAVPQRDRPQRVRVYGRMHVGVLTDDGYIVGLYRLDLDHLEPAAPDRAAKWPAIVGGAAVATVVGMSQAKRSRRRRRAAAGRCVACGYDLRATPGRCPECGQRTDRATVSLTTGDPSGPRD
jgi:hypothetical protein